jgi:hypothetical protein
MVVASCENLAVAQGWWEPLSVDEREKVCSALILGANLFVPTSPDYLVTGLEGIGDWKVDGVYDERTTS